MPLWFWCWLCLECFESYDLRPSVLASSGYAFTQLILFRCRVQDPSICEVVIAFVIREMQHYVAYWAWTWAFHRHTGLCIVLQMTLSLPLSIRKELLGLCRTQSLPYPGSTLRESMQHLNTICSVPSSPSRNLNDTTYVSMALIDVIFMYPDVFLQHLNCSIISQALRIAPGISLDDYQHMYWSSVSKELTASVNLFLHAPLDFRTIFSSDAAHRSLSFTSRLPPSEEVASDTYQLFASLRSKLSNRILFPRGGSKTVGNIVKGHFWDSYYACGLTFKHDGSGKSDPLQVTVDDCLRMYQETGGYPDGPVEVRSSWKYSQISPRVYYARGGDVQGPAQYMQELINIIIDEFPEVHRLNRFSPPHDRLSDDDVEIIYDYSSFTSTLDAVVPFVDGLAQFFRGVNVRLIDPRNGIVDMDLGLLFEEYNRVCNQYASFDISRLSVVSPDSTIFQHTCGMLGVEGNIFIATLLHGIHLRFICGLNKSRCVGDDARFHHKTIDGSFSLDDRKYAFWMLEGIGDLNMDKLMAFERWADSVLQSFRYIKRPIHRNQDIMIEGMLLALPSQIPIIGKLDSYHTVLPTSAHPCRNVFKQIIRFVDSLCVHSIGISEDVEDHSHAIWIHLSYLRRLLREEDQTGEFSEIGRSNLKTHYRLPPSTELGKVRYLDWFVGEIDYYERVRFPKYGGAEERGSCDGRAGSVMIRTQSKARSFLVRMGYLTAEMLYDEYSVSDIGLDLFMWLLSGQYSPVMRYVFIRTTPTWYAQIHEAL